VKRLTCRCGQVVYFTNHRCAACGRQLAFDPLTLDMRAETRPGEGLPFCANRWSASRCNWIVNDGEPGDSCISCQSSEIIPALSKPENLERWRKLESAKRSLLYDLLRLDLPVDSPKLRFVFKEDRRTNPDVHEEHVNIGHAEGVITINAAEADEVYREQMRQQTNEPYRTLLGHFRHEAGHFYFDRIIIDGGLLPEARQLFGDDSRDYDAALRRYYSQGPRPGWQANHISAYASAHPVEDWAETWAHYLHISAALETAAANALIPSIAEDDWQNQFIDIAIKLNEMMRALGLADAYPFVISGPVGDKIHFVHNAVARFTGRPAEPASAAD
jgi:hypothetical protein